MYILHFFTSTTVTELFKSTSRSADTSRTAFITSESLPTPEGSMITGWYLEITSTRDLPKSPTSEQQIHPEFISRISIPASFRKPPSIPISPNSFSISTTFSSATASSRSFLINVVFPAPKNPEITSIFVILHSLFPVPFRPISALRQTGPSIASDYLLYLTICYTRVPSRSLTHDPFPSANAGGDPYGASVEMRTSRHMGGPLKRVPCAVYYFGTKNAESQGQRPLHFRPSAIIMERTPQRAPIGSCCKKRIKKGYARHYVPDIPLYHPI